jgi:hypothetical protein
MPTLTYSYVPDLATALATPSTPGPSAGGPAEDAPFPDHRCLTQSGVLQPRSDPRI